jgi:hypothetical protein
VRHIGDMQDIIAMFMDALEAGIKSIDTELRLLRQMEEMEARNALVRDRVGELFSLMNSDLTDAILSLGLVSALDLEDEDRLNDLLNGYSRRIDQELQTLGENNQTVLQLIAEMRSPPEELLGLMGQETKEEEGMMLF